jgi:hypothetical protein
MLGDTGETVDVPVFQQILMPVKKEIAELLYEMMTVDLFALQADGFQLALVIPQADDLPKRKTIIAAMNTFRG